MLAQQNPLFRAGVRRARGRARHPRDRGRSRTRRGRTPDDRDLVYLLAAQYKKAGRYEDAAALYRDVAARSSPSDSVALNNLANLEFAGGEFQAAIARYKQGIESGPPPPDGARRSTTTSRWRTCSGSSTSRPRRRARRPTGWPAASSRSYDSLWKYDKGDYAVVDLGLTPDEAVGEVPGTPQGVRQKNVAGTGPRRPADGPALAAASLQPLHRLPARVRRGRVRRCARWRGPRMFTHALPEVRHAVLPALPPRHGGRRPVHAVPPPVRGARRRLRSRAQPEAARGAEGGRRGATASSASSRCVVPGAGHVYAQKTLLGLLLVVRVVAASLAAACWPAACCRSPRPRPRSRQPWGLGVAAVLLLLVVYVAANRARPDFEVAHARGASRPRPRRAPLRPRSAMALEGTIKDFGLPDIFQLIGLQRKTGLLTLKNEKDSVTVTFENGMVVRPTPRTKRLEDRLGNVLVKQGKLTQGAARRGAADPEGRPCSGWATC